MSKLDDLASEYARKHYGGEEIEAAFKAGDLRHVEAWVRNER